jgi:hypothetical protein
MQCEFCHQTLEPDAPIYRVARWDFGAFVSEVCATCCATKPHPDNTWMKGHQWRTPSAVRAVRASSPPRPAAETAQAHRLQPQVSSRDLSRARSKLHRASILPPLPNAVHAHAARRLTGEGPFGVRRNRANLRAQEALAAVARNLREFAFEQPFGLELLQSGNIRRRPGAARRGLPPPPSKTLQHPPRPIRSLPLSPSLPNGHAPALAWLRTASGLSPLSESQMGTKGRWRRQGLGIAGALTVGTAALG